MAIGSRKGEGCGAFILGCLFGPFGIVFAVMSRGNRTPCPFCKELIHNTAAACPHCQRDIPRSAAAAPTHPPSKPVSFERLLVGTIVLLAVLIIAKYLSS